MNIVLTGLGQSYYEQIKRQIAAQILSGDLPSGTKLPSIRALAAQLSVSVITTQRAYNELEHQGYIETVPGKGCYVARNAMDRLKALLWEEASGTLKEAIIHCRSSGLSEQDLRHIINQILKEINDDF